MYLRSVNGRGVKYLKSEKEENCKQIILSIEKSLPTSENFASCASFSLTDITIFCVDLLSLLLFRHLTSRQANLELRFFEE